jgi:hypothetical protein
MRSTILSRTFVAGGLALALGAAACADSTTDDMTADRDPVSDAATNRAPDATAPAGQEGATITLTGCLQKQDALMDRFILTQVNAPSTPVGTSGNNASAAERDQLRAAKHSYELEVDDNDDFDKLVGKQVRVTGKLQELSDLNRGTTGTTADAKPRANDDRRDIDANDLAKVDVETVVQVADACGTGTAR